MPLKGVSIGSKNSVVSISGNRGVDVLQNTHSNRETPCVLSFDGQAIIYGNSAERDHLRLMDSTVCGFRNLLGVKYNELTERLLKHIPSNVKVVESDEGYCGFEIKYRYLNGDEEIKKISVLEFTSIYIKELIQISSMCGFSNDCVFSYPIHFNDVQVNHLEAACKLADLSVTALITEPKSVSLEYGFSRSKMFENNKNNKKQVLFVDFGYTHVCAYVTSFTPNGMKILDLANSTDLGAVDVDDALCKYIIDKIKENYQIDINYVRTVLNEHKPFVRLLKEIEKIKIHLNLGLDSNLTIFSLYNDVDISIEIKVSTFKELIKPIIKQVISTVINPLIIRKNAIDEIELIGGCSRLIYFKEKMAKLYGKKYPIMFTLNATEVISRGCSYAAAIQSSHIRTREYDAKDISLYKTVALYKNAFQTSFSDKDSFCLTDFLKTIPQKYEMKFKLNSHIKGNFHFRIVDVSNKIVIGEYRFLDIDELIKQGKCGEIEFVWSNGANGYINYTFANYVEEKTIEYEEEVPCEKPVKNQTDKKEETKKDESKTEESKIEETKTEESKTENLNQTCQEEESKNEIKDIKQSKTINETENKSNKLETESQKKDHNVEKETTQTKIDNKKNTKIVKKTRKEYLKTPISCIKEQVYLSENMIEGYKKKITELVKFSNEQLLLCKVKNNLESYIYKLKDWLTTSYKEFIHPDQLPVLLCKVEENVEWIYSEEAEKPDVNIFENRLKVMKEIGDPIMFKYSEFTKVQEGLNTLYLKIEEFKSKKNDAIEKLKHITEEEWEKYDKYIINTQIWFENIKKKFDENPKYEMFMYHSTMVGEEMNRLILNCEKILNKQKPREPEKTEKKVPELQKTESSQKTECNKIDEKEIQKVQN